MKHTHEWVHPVVRKWWFKKTVQDQRYCLCGENQRVGFLGKWERSGWIGNIPRGGGEIKWATALAQKENK